MPEERKLVSILFADVTGSTALGDGLDPEDVRALMSRYYDHARHIIPAYGGTLEKFIGDAIMAIFGFSQAHGDDAERALAAALALREAIGTDPVLRDRFRLRIGVNTGEVVATSHPERLDFLITGDAVNVAARLQQGARPGEILVNERTHFAARAAFLFGEARNLRARGKPQPLRVFPLKGAHPKRQVEYTPFVGRTQDLLQLHVLAARTLEEQRPQLVSIVAPAGTGKTRLVEEVLTRLPPEESFQVAFARCLPYGQSLTYWPLRGLLRDLLGSEPDHKRLFDVFKRAGYQAEDAVRLSEQIRVTLGIEADSSAEWSIDRESLFATWRLLIEALAQQAPRVIVFEDLLTDELEKIPLHLEAEAKHDTMLIMLCLFFNERGKASFHDLLQAMRDADLPGSAFRDLSEIFLALKENDNSRLMRAIDATEAHQLVPHAARMRIVLAQRTGDPAPLQLARPLLERLGDRQFLRRLEEVEESLRSL